MKVSAVTKSELKNRRDKNKPFEKYNYTKKDVAQKPFLLLMLEAMTGGKDDN